MDQGKAEAFGGKVAGNLNGGSARPGRREAGSVLIVCCWESVMLKFRLELYTDVYSYLYENK